MQMPMFKKQLLVPLCAAVLILAALIYELYPSADSVALKSSASETTENKAAEAGSSSGKIVVYVSGAVNSPGVVELPEGARAVDAVNKCGGLSDAADADAINLAAKVTDEAQIKVPAKNAAGTAAAASGSNTGAESDGKININSADEAALDKLPGIGPAMAKRIIEHRQTEGLFQSLEDLKKVRGIGESKFKELKDKITL